jgi:AraC-like DNA-binding protein
MIGPIILYYFKSIIEKKLIIDFKFLLFCIPSLLIAINLWPYYQFSFPEKLKMVMAVKNHAYVRDFPMRQTLFFSFGTQKFLMLFSNVGFVAYAFFLVFKANRTNNLKAKNLKLIYSMISIISISFIPTLFLVVYANFLIPGPFTFSYLLPENLFSNYIYLLTLITPLSFLFFPKLIYGLNPQASLTNWFREAFQNKFGAKNESFAVLKSASTEKDLIIAYITNEKPYLSPSFSLHTLSKDLNIPHLRVSNCFNKEMNISFPEYRKRKRVDHAIALFKEGAHKKMSIEGISAQSGFKNKSSFFLAFQTEFNMTPSEWIAKHLG